MEETLLELQYLAIMQLCGENSAEFPTRQEVGEKVRNMLGKYEGMSLSVN
jgi:hypothetical protein